MEFSKMQISSPTQNLPDKEQKPGAAFLKLKQNLKSVIANKRLVDLKKKQAEEKEANHCTVEDELEEDIEDLECDEMHEISNIEIDEEKNPITLEEDNEEEEEADEEEEEENEIEADSSEDDEETGKKRIIIPFLNDSDDEDMLKSQVLDTNNANMSALDISLNWESNGAIISQIPTTQPLHNMKEHEEELLELCSGTFETQQEVEQPAAETSSRKILSSDEEQEEDTIRKVKKLRKKRRKQKPLEISDDEEEDEVEEEASEESAPDDIDSVKAEDEAETYVDYDSEENEVLVKVTKNELRNKTNDFVENEAELTESEWESADEDEKNMDKYDIELGDEDQFDKDKLKDELEQIHSRKMLDEDIRQVRKIQDILFDTEAQDGAVRQRQFKWKNTNNGFSLDDSKRDEDADKNADSEDDENYENKWRKLRFEREQWLQENLSKVPKPAESVLQTSNITHELSRSSYAITPKAASNIASNVAAGGFLISNVHKTARASFLERDKDLLSKIAGLKRTTNSIIIDDENEEKTITSVASSKAKNFLFSTITAEEHENLKRKADQLLNVGDQQDYMALKKRAKTDMKKSVCFIDQLL